MTNRKLFLALAAMAVCVGLMDAGGQNNTAYDGPNHPSQRDLTRETVPHSFDIIPQVRQYDASGDILIIGDGGTETTIEPILTAAGYTVTIVSDDVFYDGTNPVPEEFDAVILLDGVNYEDDMPESGQVALVSYVENGGGFILTEWIAWEVSNLRYQSMTALVPLTRTSGYSGLDTYSVIQTHPVTEGVNEVFDLNTAGNIGFANSGSVLVTGATAGDAVVVKELGEGRIVEFSSAGNYAGLDPFSVPEMQLLLTNAANWVSMSSDSLAQPGICYATTGSADVTNPGALISIDPTTGAGTLIGPTGIIGDDGPGVRALAIKSTGEMYALSHEASSDLHTVDASTGAGTFVANTGLLYPGAIAFDQNDVLYAVDRTDILFTLDEETGVRTVVGSTGVLLSGLAYDPTDGTMYASGTNDDIYTIDTQTGATTLIGTTGLGGNVPDIHFDESGSLFGSKPGGLNGISDYISIDKTSGAGTVIGPIGFLAVAGMATRITPPPDPLAQFGICYGGTGDQEPNYPGALLSIDPATGAATLIGLTGIIGDLGPSVRALAIKSTGEMYALSHLFSSDLYTVNASTGEGTFVANTGLLQPGDLLFDGNDDLYATDRTNVLYTLDEVTGVRTVVGSMGVGISGLAFDPTDGMMYGSSGSGDSIYTIDKSTGAVTLIGSTGFGISSTDIHFDEAGNLFGAVAGSGGVSDYISINKTTGAGTLIGSTGFYSVAALTTRLELIPTIPCGDIFFFNAKCNANGAAQAMVKITGDWTGETVTFDLDGDDYVALVLSNGTNSIAKMQIPAAGFGSHAVTLERPAHCYSAVTFNCQVDAPPDPEWDALWAEYEVLEQAAAVKAIPAETRIIGNYPNPFNPSTTIRYALSVDSPVSVRVYNMLGQEVTTLVNGFQKAGEQSVVWHGVNNFGQSVASGLYIYRLQTGNTVMTQKMLFIK